MLLAEEVERGWVEHVCDDHGFLVATTPRAMVTCECGKVARILRSGRIVDEKTLRPTKAAARSLNSAGQPNLYACDECGEDFGSKTLLSRHRVGGKKTKCCLTAFQMLGREWFVDERGRWRQRGPKSPDTRSRLTVSEAVEALLAPQNQGLDSSPSEVPERLKSANPPKPEKWANPTRNWPRAAPGSRGGATARERSTSTTSGFVYFFQGDTTRRIKIGFSQNPTRRFEEIRSGASERMRLLGAVPGTTGDEAALHRTNATAHVLNEWFAEDALPDVARVLNLNLDDLDSIPFT